MGNTYRCMKPPPHQTVLQLTDEVISPLGSTTLLFTDQGLSILFGGVSTSITGVLTNAKTCKLTAQGQLVVLDPQGTVLWQTFDAPNQCAGLDVQDNGEVVIYLPSGEVQDSWWADNAPVPAALRAIPAEIREIGGGFNELAGKLRRFNERFPNIVAERPPMPIPPVHGKDQGVPRPPPS